MCTFFTTNNLKPCQAFIVEQASLSFGWTYSCKTDLFMTKLDIMILGFRTDRPWKTVQTQIRLLLEEKSDHLGVEN